MAHDDAHLLSQHYLHNPDSRLDDDKRGCRATIWLVGVLFALTCVCGALVYFVANPGSIMVEHKDPTIESSALLFEREAKGEIFDLKCDCNEPIEPANAFHPASIFAVRGKIPEALTKDVNDFDVSAITSKCLHDMGLYKAIMEAHPFARNIWWERKCLPSKNSVDFRCNDDGTFMKTDWTSACDTENSYM